MSILDEQEVGLPCPNCGHEIKKPFAWFKTHDVILCPACGSDMLGQRDKLVREANEQLKSFDEIMADIRRG